MCVCRNVFSCVLIHMLLYVSSCLCPHTQATICVSSSILISYTGYSYTGYERVLKCVSSSAAGYYKHVAQIYVSSDTGKSGDIRPQYMCPHTQATTSVCSCVFSYTGKSGDIRPRAGEAYCQSKPEARCYFRPSQARILMTDFTLSSNSRRDTVLALKKNLKKEGHPSCSDEGGKKGERHCINPEPEVPLTSRAKRGMQRKQTDYKQ